MKLLVCTSMVLLFVAVAHAYPFVLLDLEPTDADASQIRVVRSADPQYGRPGYGGGGYRPGGYRPGYGGGGGYRPGGFGGGGFGGSASNANAASQSFNGGFGGFGGSASQASASSSSFGFQG